MIINIGRIYLQADRLDGRQNAVPAMSINAKQMTIHVVRFPGTGLGISIAGGLGSHPFLDDDEVRLFILFHSVLFVNLAGLEFCVCYLNLNCETAIDT